MRRLYSFTEKDTRLTNACVPCFVCGSKPAVFITITDKGSRQYRLFCSSGKPHEACGNWFDSKAKAALDWNERQRSLRWNPERNLGELLKACPFCGRKMVFYRNEITNSRGNKTTEQYYTHEDAENSKDRCVLDEMKIPAGDARPDEGYIGEYAELWNERADV